MIPILCPICGSELFSTDRSMICVNHHCFDRAKSGYVNLLPPSGKGKRHGDDKLMVHARSAFLDKGYYDPLSDVLSQFVYKYTLKGSIILDIGCGEGKYTGDVYHHLVENDQSSDMIGIDISKYALSSAARKEHSIHYYAASSAKLPLGDHSIDVVLNVFSPLFVDELKRVLKDDGFLVRVVPREHHLIELKQCIYNNPYLNDAPEESLPGFDTIEYRDISYTFLLSSNEDIQNLFSMTPYYYKTSAADQAKLSKIDALSITAEFRILILRPSQNCTT